MSFFEDMDMTDLGIDMAFEGLGIVSDVTGYCFGDDGKVDRLQGDEVEVVTVADIQAGDLIRTINGFKRVVYIHQGGSSEPVVQVDFQTKAGTVDALYITPRHLVYAGVEDDTKQASELKVGDKLQMLEGEAVVIGLSATSHAVRSLITTDGELLVNGLRVSSYAYNDHLHRLTQSVGWASRWSPSAVQRLCRAGSPAVSRWLLPLMSRDLRYRKRMMKTLQRTYPQPTESMNKAN